MKTQNNRRATIALQSLAAVFAIFFVMAFACKDGGDNPPESITDGDVLTKEIVERLARKQLETTEMFTNRTYSVEFHDIQIGKPSPMKLTDTRYVPGRETLQYPAKTRFTRTTTWSGKLTKQECNWAWSFQKGEWDWEAGNGNGVQPGDTCKDLQ